MKNHLFIGLGGQGGKSIAELRKVFKQREKDFKSLETKGHQFDFLYIDSSRDVINHRENWTYFGENLTLDNDSFLYLKDGGHTLNADALALRPDIGPWIGNGSVLKGFLAESQGIQGANQRRRFGRLLFANNASRIRQSICGDKIAPLLASGNQCVIHIFASLAGGTGSGSIVDLVTLLRHEYPDSSVADGFPIFLYLYVTSDDFAQAQVGYFHQNQYAALKDLNALACGQFRPTLLGFDHGGEEFSGKDPITQIVLSTSLNDRNQKVPLATQHQIVAESTFEWVFAYCNGNLDPSVQKAFTGEDILASFPGEPTGNLLRSFRFASAGMRRWEIPIEKIRELLANELYVSSFRQMLFQNWNENSGFLYEKSAVHQSLMTSIVSDLSQTIESTLIENTRLNDLLKELSDDFGKAHSGMKNEGFRDMDLEDYEQRLRQRYETDLEGSGVREVFISLEKNRDARVMQLVQNIQKTILRAWTRSESPLGLASVPDALLHLQEYVKTKISGGVSQNNLGNDRLNTRMSARKKEWDKMTFLSYPFKQNQIAQAHKTDLVSLLSGDLRDKAANEDVNMLDQLFKEIGALDGAYRKCMVKFEAWHNKCLYQRDNIRQALSSMQEDDFANKCELSDSTLEAYVDAQRRDFVHLQNATAQFRDEAILSVIGSGTLDSIGSLSEGLERKLWEKGDDVAYGWSLQIHNDIVSRGSVAPVLTSHLLDTLQQKYSKDAEGFRAEMQKFIDSATCSARLDNNQLQPKVLRGDSNMPAMPKKALVLGLPKSHPFSKDLEAMIKPLMPAGGGFEQGVYFHDEPTQVRLLFMASWMAARFTKVVKELEEKYVSATLRNVGGDIAYFTNLDERGQKGRRASLLLPSPEESRIEMKAVLWLGRKISLEGTKTLIQEGDTGVILLIKRDDGYFDSNKLGNSFSDVERQADITQINRVSDAVRSTVIGLAIDKLEELRQEVRTEDSKNLGFGSASREYGDWTKVRNKLIEILT